MARSGPTRSSPRPDPIWVRFDAFELDEANVRLLREGKAITLPPTPFAVLCALARRSGSLLTKHNLLDEVWGHRFVGDSVLKTAISDLRTALGDDPRNPRFIETVSRRGYRFIADTRPARTAPAVPAQVTAAGAPAASSFVGRAAALARLRHAWESACSGRRSIVWVAGEPGIGKTALIEHFIANLGDVACARGQCVDHYGTCEPYLPLLEALADLSRSDNAVAPLLRAVAPTWLLHLPWLSTAEERDALRRELAGVSPERMPREMGELLDRYTAGRPLLLVTEDLHWSDRATVELIDYLARRRSSSRLMWLASFRLAEVVALDHPLHPVRHELRVHRLCDEIVLDSFSESEVADYVAERYPSFGHDEAFARSLHARTDGVPLFVASVMSDLAARAAQSGHDGVSAAQLDSAAVPQNLAAIIDHYVAQLDGDQRTLLSAAAVCGTEFRVVTVAEVLGRDPAAVSQACDELAREQLWLTPSRDEHGRDLARSPYSFRHALFRQVLYERTAPWNRAQLHCRVGAALERERAAGARVAPAELAAHFERGGEPLTAMRHYAEAADAALEHLRPDESLEFAERGLILVDRAARGVERDALEFALATLCGAAAFQARGFGSEAEDAYRRAYALLDAVPQHPMRGQLLHGLGWLLCLRAEYADALAVVERAEALASATGSPALLVTACTVRAQVHFLQGQPRAARDWIERALPSLALLDAAPGHGYAADPQVTLHGMLALQLLHLGLVIQAREVMSHAYERALEVAQPMARIVAMWDDALLELRLGNAERVGALADQMHALVEQYALAQGRTASQWFRGWADARLHDALEGHHRIREACEENMKLGMLAGTSETLGYAAEALVLAGEWDAAETQVREAFQYAEQHDERVYLPQLHLIEAAIAHARGEPGVALAATRRAVAEAQVQEAPWLELLALVELCGRDGSKSEDRRRLVAILDELPESIGTPTYARARALLDGTTTS